MPDLFTFTHRAQIILAAARNKVPAVYWASEFVRDGGLLSYGVDMVDIIRRAATYVDRILRGAKPGDRLGFHNHLVDSSSPASPTTQSCAIPLSWGRRNSL